MYVRFLGHESEDLGLGEQTRTGIFQSALTFWYDLEGEEWLKAAVREDLDWFNEHLPKPPETTFSVRSRKRYLYQGLCWFHASAHDMIARARNLAALLHEADLVIDTLYTHRPGTVLYRDDFQIVARPDTFRQFGK